MPHPSTRFRSALLTFLPTCLLVAMLAFAARPAEAATITVCAVGCDATTIEGALFTALTNGDLDDTIQIGAGTYTLGSTLFVNDANTTLTFEGADPATTIIQADATPQTAAFSVFTIGGVSAKTINISNVTIRHGNRAGAGQFGGGIEIASGNTVNLNNVIVTTNRAAFGGGIYNAGNLTITNSRIENNIATNNGGGGDGAGGGIYNGASELTVSNSVIVSNTAVFGGGGIRNFTGGTLTMTQTLVERNATDTVGGAIHSNGVLTITQSTLISNTAVLNGGAINNEGSGIVSITNTTFGVNTTRDAFGTGGAISNANNATISFSTFYQNSTPFSGDTFANGAAPNIITVSNSIIEAHPSGSGNTCNFTGIINGTNNLSSNANGCSSLDALGAPTGLGSLANNGGATPTHALQNNSNAIDLADTCPASGTDQRGETRDDLACDIGAFELVFADDATVSRSTGNTPAELPGSFGPTLVSITNVNSGDPGTIVITKTTEAPGGGVPSADELPVTWFISAIGGSYDVDMLLCYTDAELGALAPSEGSLMAYRWDTSLPTPSWQLGGASSSADTVNNCVVVTGVTEFSAWTVAANTPSAVTLAHTAVESHPTTTPWLLVGLLVLFTAVGLRLHRQQG